MCVTYLDIAPFCFSVSFDICEKYLWEAGSIGIVNPVSQPRKPRSGKFNDFPSPHSKLVTEPG